MELAVNTQSLPLPWQSNLWMQLCGAKAKQRLPHALLLSGDEGLGKSLFAEAFARLLLCEHATESACDHCRSCELFDADNHPDFHLMEPEVGHALKVDAIRALKATIMQTAHQGRGRVVVIKSADAMNTAASNALLKMLEEPPKGVTFILVSSFPHRLLPTIRSRAQPVRLLPSSDEGSQAWLAEQLPGEANNTQVWLNLAEGAPLKALRLANVEQRAWRKQCLQDLLALVEQTSEPSKIVETWLKQDAATGLAWLASWLTDAAKLAAGIELAGPIHPAYQKVLHTLTQRYNKPTLCTLFQKVNETRHLLLTNSALNPALLLEGLMIDLFIGDINYAIH